MKKEEIIFKCTGKPTELRVGYCASKRCGLKTYNLRTPCFLCGCSYYRVPGAQVDDMRIIRKVTIIEERFELSENEELDMILDAKAPTFSQGGNMI